MAVENATFAAPRPAAGFEIGLAEVAYVAFLLLIFVGLSPFATRDLAALAAGENGTATESGFSGAGDIVRQIAYLAIFALVAVAAFRRNGLRLAGCISALFVLLLFWCLLSAYWAPEPGVTFRRAMLATVIVLSAMLSVDTLGAQRSLQLLRYVLAAVLIINWISIPLIRQAVHLPGEASPQLVGNWRGLYFHKNITGGVCALTAILFFFHFLRTRHLFDFMIFAGAVVFTIMTRSKSSLGLLPVAIAIGCFYRLAWRRGVDRAIVCVLLLLCAVAAMGLVVYAWGDIVHALADPNEFTGRMSIWQGEFAFIHDHPLLGAGFGSFADTGAASPLHNYVSDVWVQNISHGHNAYLQLFVTIGGIGFILAMLVFVMQPLREFWRQDGSDVAFKSVLLAIFVFMLLHNFLESDFLEGDDPSWVIFLLMLAMLHQSRVLPRAAAISARRRLAQ
jgi:O-antigen ligase